MGEAIDKREVVAKVQEFNPDVLLLDQDMLQSEGSSTLATLQVVNNRTRVIVTASTNVHEELVEAIRLGARGIIMKNSPPALIVKSIQRVHSGEIWLDSQTIDAVLRRFTSAPSPQPEGERTREHERISPREREIVALVARGYKNKEMSDLLFISEQTVKNHLHNIFRKVGVSDRLGLALYAVHSGLYVTSDGPPKIPPQKEEPEQAMRRATSNAS